MKSNFQKKIVIIHYHLKRGGVTSSIEASYKELKSRGYDVLVFTGEKPTKDNIDKSHIKILKNLNYMINPGKLVPGDLLKSLEKEAINYWGSLPDIWHFHNSGLAKNVLYPSLVYKMASKGHRIVIQIHDFVENGRPNDYHNLRSYYKDEEELKKILYPVAKHIHYVTINLRDFNILKSSGIPKSNIHLVPNAVLELDVKSKAEQRPFSKNKLFALYPTRGIRRKNLGELLLLSLIYGDRIDFATTLAPENDRWMNIYNLWEKTIEELKLPVKLGISVDTEYSFLDLIGWSDFIVTTSVSEGFGLSFLEPWMIGKSVLGRDISEITKDFIDKGVSLDCLYSSIKVPFSWISKEEFEKEVKENLKSTYLKYNVQFSEKSITSFYDFLIKRLVKKNYIDFGNLNENIQIKILKKLKSDPSKLDDMEIPTLSFYNKDEIKINKKIIQDSYGIKSYGDKLEKLYKKVSKSKIKKISNISSEEILFEFLSYLRFKFLCS